MKKIVRLKESELTKIVVNVIKEGIDPFEVYLKMNKDGVYKNLNTTDKDGWTPFIYACSKINVEVINKILDIKKGKDINHQTKRGNNGLNEMLLTLSFRGEQITNSILEVIKRMLDLGLNIDSPDSNSNSPLIVCAIMGWNECAELLIKNGASKTFENSKGYSYEKILIEKQKVEREENVILINKPTEFLELETTPNKLYGLVHKSLFEENDYLSQINEVGYDVEFLLINNISETNNIFRKICLKIKRRGLDYDAPSVVALFNLGDKDLLIKIDSGNNELKNFKSNGIYEFVSHYSDPSQLQNEEILDIINLL